MIVYHEKYLSHVLSSGHPESPARLQNILDGLFKSNLLRVLTPEPASLDTLEKVHTSSYVNAIKNHGFIDPEAPVHWETFKIAQLAAGGAVIGAEYAFEQRTPCFALVRPPGHHAGQDYGGGFCYFDNIAVAARHLGKRCALIDIDLHHGNGTSDIFYETGKLYISTHQRGIYPGTGHIEEVGVGKGEGFNVNIPFEHGCGDASFTMAYDELIEPMVTQYSPEIMLISYGADAHYADPLGGLTLSSPGYVALARRLIELAKTVCGNRICFVLEGGYNLRALAETVTGIVAAFYDRELEYEFTDVKDTSGRGKATIARVKDVQSAYWSL